jgi:hypothetical protein
MLLLVGDKDSNQGAFRKRFHQVDLCRRQGFGRRERAMNWFGALRQAVMEENLALHSRMRILKNTYHRVNQLFADTAMTFLGGSDDV